MDELADDFLVLWGYNIVPKEGFVVREGDLISRFSVKSSYVT